MAGAAGYPEHLALVSLFASRHWRRAILSDDLLVVTQAIAEFHRRFPLQAPLRGTSRTWLSTTITATARQVEALLPMQSASHEANLRQERSDGTMHKEVSVHP